MILQICPNIHFFVSLVTLVPFMDKTKFIKSHPQDNKNKQKFLSAEILKKSTTNKCYDSEYNKTLYVTVRYAGLLLVRPRLVLPLG